MNLPTFAPIHDSILGCGQLIGPTRLPLKGVKVRGRVEGLAYQVTITQHFHNDLLDAAEVTYTFPLPSRAGVESLTATLGSRTVVGTLMERQQAREEYQDAVAHSKRAALMEEDRPDVFTTTLGNLQPGEDATVEITFTAPLEIDLLEATLRIPMCVAPRYTAGAPAPSKVGTGDSDTDLVPDASRVTPPRLTYSDPRPSLDVEITLDSALLGNWRSSLHAMWLSKKDTQLALTLDPNTRLDRDLILRADFTVANTPSTRLDLYPTSNGGVCMLTVIPTKTRKSRKKRQIVIILDASGSMAGWKLRAAARCAAEMVESLTSEVEVGLVIYSDVSTPGGMEVVPMQLATDANKAKLAQKLRSVTVKGGTDTPEAIELAKGLFTSNDRAMVLITDGQISGEDRALRILGQDTITHIVGVDEAANDGFLRRMATLTGGCYESVESESRLDEALSRITTLTLPPLYENMKLDVDTTLTLPKLNLHAAAPLVVYGKYEVAPTRASLPDLGEVVIETHAEQKAPVSVWARQEIRRMEDTHILHPDKVSAEDIIQLSLSTGVLSRFTAFLAVDAEQTLSDSMVPLVQPIENPAGWQISNSVLGGPLFGGGILSYAGSNVASNMSSNVGVNTVGAAITQTYGHSAGSADGVTSGESHTTGTSHTTSGDLGHGVSQSVGSYDGYNSTSLPIGLGYNQGKDLSSVLGAVRVFITTCRTKPVDTATYVRLLADLLDFVYLDSVQELIERFKQIPITGTASAGMLDAVEIQLNRLPGAVQSGIPGYPALGSGQGVTGQPPLGWGQNHTESRASQSYTDPSTSQSNTNPSTSQSNTDSSTSQSNTDSSTSLGHNGTSYTDSDTH